MAGNGDQGDYSDEERASFGIWVELGAVNPDQQWIMDLSPRVRWERNEPSGSEWVFDLLKNPRPVLMREGVPGIHGRSRITTTINHHHRGLNHRIIRISATVERTSGDVSLELDKENNEP